MTDASPSDSANERAAVLVCLRGEHTGQPLPLQQACTRFGRDQDCDVVLTDATVSPTHAEIHHHGHGTYTLLDAGSLTGTYHNRRPVTHAALTDGDEIWIGTARYQFHSPTAGAHSEP